MVQFAESVMLRYKNDYKVYTDLQRFANENPLGKILKPWLKDFYHELKRYLPYPRDFLIRRVPRGGVCLEIGVYDGIFSERILRIAKPKHLVLVDPWATENNTGSKVDPQSAHDARYAHVLSLFAEERTSGVVRIIRSTSDEALESLRTLQFDFVYIDGDHSYSQVQKDLQHYFPLVRPGGLLAGDDYHYDSVRQAVDEFVAAHGLRCETKDEQFIIPIPTTKTPSRNS